MPPRRFASPRRCFPTPSSLRFLYRRLGLGLLFFALASAVATIGVAQVQSSGPKPALGNAQLARARARQFVLARGLPAASTPQKNKTRAEALANARGQHAAMLAARATPQALANLTTAWQPLGPVTVTSQLYGAVTGRITSIALDPSDVTGNTVWLGTTGGGIWKSTNAAGALANVRFAPLTDTLPVFAANAGTALAPSLSIGAVAVQPASTAIVLAGTGDPNDATDSYYGEGILRSADGGQTWTLAAGSRDGANGNHSFIGLATAGLAWSSTSPSTVVAAMSNALEGDVVGAPLQGATPGLYFSTDAGITWQMASVYDGTQLVQSPRPLGTVQTGTTATAVVWDPQRSLFFAALSFHGYYSSPDGQTWTRLANQPGAGLTRANCPVGSSGTGSANCPILRGALAVQPGTGDLYALTVDANEADQGLWQDLCNLGANGQCATPTPAFATRLDGGAMEIGQGATGSSTVVPQGTYNLTLAAAPAANNGTALFAGTVDLYRCTIAAGASSCTLRNTTNAGNGCNAPAAVAPAQHALAALGQASGAPLLLVGNDGGLWRSTDGVAQTGSVCAATDASHFDNLNPAIGAGGSLAEVVGFAQDPSSTDILIAGLGANGSAATSTAGALPTWPQMSAGEGGFPQIDPATPNNWFVAVGAGVNLDLCAHGAACGAQDFVPPASVGPAETSYDAALLDAPTLLDPQATSNLLTATCRLWRGPAQGGSAWSPANALSPAMDGSATPCTLNSALIRSIGAGGPAATSPNAANTGSEVLYAGMAGAQDGGGALGGHIFVTQAANTATGTTPWMDRSASPVTNNAGDIFNASGFDLSAVVVDAHDPTGATVYATVMGFSDGASVYRSTDFGAHWTGISANLPDAPVNGLVIDPNDANTVYVALDTGVYATQAVTTCASANCWSVLGTALPNAPVTALEAGAQMPTADGHLGMLRAGTYGRGIWQIPLLSVVSLTQPKLSADPTTLTFASQTAQTESTAQTVTLTSNGSAPVTIAKLAIAGDFVETDTCAGKTLAVGSTCTVSVQFAPTVAGARSGLLTIYADIAGGQVTVSLAGTATAPASVVLTPLQLSFPATLVNQAATSEIVTVSNLGGTAALLSGETITGDFAITANTCGSSLPAQTGCSIAITFTPTASGTRTGVLTVTDNEGTQTAQLTGVGNSPATDTLSPASLTFAQQQVGTTSAPQQVILTNSGDVALTLITETVTGGDFAATNSCGNSLAPHSTCTVKVVFVPTATGTRTGTLQVTDEFRTQTVPLSGVGIAPAGISLSPSSIDFGSMGVGLKSQPTTLTLTNNGGLPLTLASTVATGDFAVLSSSCGATLAAGNSCSLGLLFAPTTAGTRSGSLTLTDNAASGTQSVALTGIGMDFSLTANGATSVSVASGTSATFPLVVSSLAGLSGNVSLTCTGAPANAVCTVNPASAAMGGTVQVTAVVETGTTATADLRRPIRNYKKSETVLLFAAAPLVFVGLRRRPQIASALRRGSLGAALVLLLILSATGGLAGCGANRVIPMGVTGGGDGGGGSGGGSGGGGSSSPTQSGSYPILVTGTAAGITHSVKLTLVVQ